MTVALRGFAPADVAALRAIYNAQVAPAPGWTEAEAALAWGSAEPARAAGARIAVRGDRVVGGVSVVPVPPWLYVFPLIAADDEVATLLLATALGHAAAPGIERIRIGVRTGEDAKRDAVVARGFTRSIDMIDVARSVAGAPVAAPAARLARVAPASIDRDRLRALHDRTFVDVPNGGAIAPAELDLIFDGPEAWPAATAVWADADDRYLGFVLGLRGTDDRGEFGRVDAIGVDRAMRGQGLARQMLHQLLVQATVDQLAEVRAVIASSNHASLGLHRAAGFVEVGRRAMWDLDPTGA